MAATLPLLSVISVQLPTPERKIIARFAALQPARAPQEICRDRHRVAAVCRRGVCCTRPRRRATRPSAGRSRRTPGSWSGRTPCAPRGGCQSTQKPQGSHLARSCCVAVRGCCFLEVNTPSVDLSLQAHKVARLSCVGMQNHRSLWVRLPTKPFARLVARATALCTASCCCPGANQSNMMTRHVDHPPSMMSGIVTAHL